MVDTQQVHRDDMEVPDAHRDALVFQHVLFQAQYFDVDGPDDVQEKWKFIINNNNVSNKFIIV